MQPQPSFFRLAACMASSSIISEVNFTTTIEIFYAKIKIRQLVTLNYNLNPE
jgi:hypothetical protein